MGFGSILSKVVKGAGKNLPVIGAGVGALEGLLSARNEGKASKAEAANVNATNRYRHGLDRATYETENMPSLKKRDRSNAFRKQIAAALANNPKYGMARLFPGFFQQEKQYAGDTTTNPFAVAGPPPEMQAVGGGGFSGALTGALGGGLKGAAAGLDLRSGLRRP